MTSQKMELTPKDLSERELYLLQISEVEQALTTNFNSFGIKSS